MRSLFSTLLFVIACTTNAAAQDNPQSNATDKSESPIKLTMGEPHVIVRGIRPEEQLWGPYQFPRPYRLKDRFHRTLKQEVLQGRHFKNHAELQNTFDSWQNVYNQKRPHEALDYKTPIERYRVSSRGYPERLRKFEYDSGFTVRKVSPGGRIVFKNKDYYLSRSFRGQLVGIRSR